MSVIERKIPRTQKPSRVIVSKAASKHSGLVAFVDRNTLVRDYADNTVTNTAVSLKGKDLDLGSVAELKYLKLGNKLPEITTELTLIAKVKPNFVTGENSYPYIFTNDLSAAAPSSGFRLLYNKDIDNYRFIIHAGGSGATCDFTSNSSFQNKEIVIWCRYDGTNMTIGRNKSQIAQTAKTGTITAPTVEALFGIAGDEVAANEWGGLIEYVQVFKVAKTNAEIYSLIDSPYQVLPPQTRYIPYITAADTTPPILSSPTGIKTGSTTGSGTVSTDEGNGTLYFWATTNTTETAPNIKASGDSQLVTATGVQNVTFSGLSPSTSYYAHFVQDDAATNESNVVNSSPAFLTDAAGLVVIYPTYYYKLLMTGL